MSLESYKKNTLLVFGPNIQFIFSFSHCKWRESVTKNLVFKKELAGIESKYVLIKKNVQN